MSGYRQYSLTPRPIPPSPDSLDKVGCPLKVQQLNHRVIDISRDHSDDNCREKEVRERDDEQPFPADRDDLIDT